MTDVLYIGFILNAPNQMAAQRFQMLHDSLLIMPVTDTTQALTDRSSITAGIHIESLTQPSPSRLTLMTGIMEHTVSSIAQDQLEIVQGNKQKDYLGFGWVPFARRSLEEYAERIKLSRVVLGRSIFFSHETRILRQLGRHSLRCIEPGGQYERYAFVAGVATNQLKTQYHDSTSLRRRSKKSSAA